MKNRDFFCSQKGCKLIGEQLVITYEFGYLPMPTIKKQEVDLDNLEYIGFQNTRRFDERNPKRKTVGYFLDDRKFRGIIARPWNYVSWISQYKQTLSLDVSCYVDMNMDEQWLGVYLNRLIGVYWQQNGLIVIPTVSWGDEATFAFCFSGIELGSVVAVSTIGTSKNYEVFMKGFIKMCEEINPVKVICYCKPYSEMHRYADILTVEHEGAKAKKESKYRVTDGQTSLFDHIKYKEVS